MPVLNSAKRVLTNQCPSKLVAFNAHPDTIVSKVLFCILLISVLKGINAQEALNMLNNIHAHRVVTNHMMVKQIV